MPTIEDLLDEIYDLKVQSADISREVDDLENTVYSVTERIDELLTYSPATRSSKDWRDQYARARDKRRNVREIIAEKRQEKNRIEARIETLTLRMEYGEIEGG